MGHWLDQALDLAHDAGCPPPEWQPVTMVRYGGITDGWTLTCKFPDGIQEAVAPTLDQAAFSLVNRLRPEPAETA